MFPDVSKTKPIIAPSALGLLISKIHLSSMSKKRAELTDFPSDSKGFTPSSIFHVNYAVKIPDQ